MLDLRPVQRVPLAKAPLVIVIAQVRFAVTPGLVSGAEGESVRELLSSAYPDARGEHHQVTVQRPDGTVEIHQIDQWILSTIDGHTRVTIASDFVALQTTSYTSREDFQERFRFLIATLTEVAHPPVVHRLGVRYVDRLTGEDRLERLSDYIRPELCAAVVDRDASVALLGQAVQTTLRAGDDEVLLRSLVLPPQGFYDVMIDPVPEPAWVLDIDAYTTQQFGFDLDQTVEVSARLTERVYSAFRWVVTDRFLQEHE